MSGHCLQVKNSSLRKQGQIPAHRRAVISVWQCSSANVGRNWNVFANTEIYRESLPILYILWWFIDLSLLRLKRSEHSHFWHICILQSNTIFCNDPWCFGYSCWIDSDWFSYPDFFFIACSVLSLWKSHWLLYSLVMNTGPFCECVRGGPLPSSEGAICANCYSLIYEYFLNSYKNSGFFALGSLPECASLCQPV